MKLIWLSAAAFYVAGCTAQLHKLAAKHGRYFGSACSHLGEDARYDSILRNPAEYGQMSPVTAQMWDVIQPEEGVWDWEAADEIAEYAADGCQRLRCGTLFNPNHVPRWVSHKDWANKNEIRQYLRDFVTTVVKRYEGKCESWNLVSEAIDDDGNYKDTWINRRFGPEWIKIVFIAANLAVPETMFYYNDGGIEKPGPKANAVKNLVEYVRNGGGDIDGIGMQCHFDVDFPIPYSDMRDAMRFFEALECEVAVTELDVRILLPASSGDLHKQNIIFKRIVKACLNVDACQGVTVWDFYDKFNTAPLLHPGYGNASLLFENFAKHSAYYGIVEVLHVGSDTCPVRARSDDTLDFECIDLATLQEMQRQADIDGVLHGQMMVEPADGTETEQQAVAEQTEEDASG